MSQAAVALDASPSPFRWVGGRFDWLTVAYRVDLNPGVLDHLRERELLTTDDEGKRLSARVDLEGIPFELRPPRVAHWWVLRNDTTQIKLDEKAAGGWVLEVTISGSAMMALSGGEALDTARRVAELFGEVQETRLRRVDVALDVAGWKIREGDGERFITWGRSTKHAECPEEDGDVYEQREYRSRSSLVTGFTICPGNPVMGRLYNKREELSFRPDKRDAEEATWRANGWDGEAPVTRVEWQVRGEALDDLKLRDPAELLSQSDRLLAYLRSWVRMIVPGTAARRTRCDVDPRWEFIQSIRFDPFVVPLERDRSHRGGAKAMQALGSILSCLARNDDLPEAPPLVTPDGQIATDEKEWSEGLTSEEAERFVFDSLQMLHERHVKHVVAELSESGYVAAARLLMQKWRAVEARKSTILVLEAIRKRKRRRALERDSDP